MNAVRLKETKLKALVGSRVQMQFMARDISVRPQRDKVSKMLCLNMTDCGVVVDAKIFNVSEAIIEKVVNGVVYDAMVDVQAYDKSPSGFSCIISDIQPSGANPQAFLDWSENIQQSRDTIEKALQSIIESTYGAIAYRLVIKKWNEFQYWTAARGVHHTSLGGLLVHTAEVVDTADELARYYNFRYGYAIIDRNLLIASAILHDLCKIDELKVDMLSGITDYSTASSLSTHIMGIISDVDIQAYELRLGYEINDTNEFNEEQETKSPETLAKEKEEVALLKHCLAAHHGRLEWGSPITPSVSEAYILHKADEMSAQMYRYYSSYKEMESGTSLSKWEHGESVVTYKSTSK